MKDDGTTERRTVEVGIEGDSTVQIASGLTAGEKVQLTTTTTSPGGGSGFPRRIPRRRRRRRLQRCPYRWRRSRMSLRLPRGRAATRAATCATGPATDGAASRAAHRATGTAARPATAHAATDPSVVVPVPVIAVRGVRKAYGEGEATVHALRGPSDPSPANRSASTLDIDQGDFVAVMGSSGSGKSTLMNILGCLDVPTAGRYLLDGIDVGAPGRAPARPGPQPQDRLHLPVLQPGAAHRPRWRERRAAAGLRRGAGGGARGGGRWPRSAGSASATRLGHRPNELSGGQQQRVAVARALVTSPAMLLADEPTGNLDSRSTEEVLGIVDRLNAAGRTVVLITHEDEVARHAKRVMRLVDGRGYQCAGPSRPPPPTDPARPATRSEPAGTGRPVIASRSSGSPAAGSRPTRSARR